MARYEVRFCGLGERAKLIRFIRDSWSRNHIFVEEPKLLDWQYRADDKYNFVVVHNSESGEFEGVLGFTSPSFFEERRVGNDDNLWLSLWKVNKKDGQPPSLGLDMLAFLREKIRSLTVAAVGINSQVARVYRALGCTVGSLRHFYIPNWSHTNFGIAQSLNLRAGDAARAEGGATASRNIRLTELWGSDLNMFMRLLPPGGRNRPSYFVNRYQRHPTYSYRFFAVEVGEQPVSLVVLRKIHVLASSCLRIVDFLGLDALDCNLSGSMQKLLRAEQSEYVDLLVGGPLASRVGSLGFFETTQESFVPHLFEPFSPERVRVDFAVFNRKELTVFKGDSDLDRPNEVVKFE